MWRCLLENKAIERIGFVELPEGLFWPSQQKEKSRILFVCDCTKKLFDKIMAFKNVRAESQGVVLTGNPGIGKSWFLRYCLFQLARLEATIFYEYVAGRVAWLFLPDGSVSEYKLEGLDYLSIAEL